MITNIWNDIEVYCPRHDELIPLEIQTGSKVLFYACPKYMPDKREKNETACRNFIYLNEYEKMINKISSMLEEAQLNNEIVDLTGEKWTDNGIDFEIFEHDKKIKVKMLNRKALK